MKYNENFKQLILGKEFEIFVQNSSLNNDMVLNTEEQEKIQKILSIVVDNKEIEKSIINFLNDTNSSSSLPKVESLYPAVYFKYINIIKDDDIIYLAGEQPNGNAHGIAIVFSYKDVNFMKVTEEDYLL